MKILRTLLLSGLICGASVSIQPCKSVIMGEAEELSFRANLIVSFLLVLFVCIMSSIFTNISSFFTVAGIVGGIFISFIIPGAIALKTGYAKTLVQKICLYTFMATFSLIFVVGTIFSIKEFKIE